MASSFVSLSTTDSKATAPSSLQSSDGKSAMLSMLSGLDLTQDTSAVAMTSGSRSAAKDLLASKSAEKQAEVEFELSKVLKKQQQKAEQKNQKEQPITALGQAMSFFEQEMDERDSFLSRNTKRRKHDSKKMRGVTTALSRGRRHRQKKYKLV